MHVLMHQIGLGQSSWPVTFWESLFITLCCWFAVSSVCSEIIFAFLAQEVSVSCVQKVSEVQLTVMDVNDFRPRFSERVFTTSVFENEPVGTSVITLKATDLDEGENALLTYSLQGPGADAFSLDPDTGLIRSLRLLQSFERFNLTMVATDHGRPPLWGTASLQITVIDVNDNRPVFVRPANGTIMHILERM
ncbi:cadherin-23-like [Pimephales promelas]|uniref:cadherin-23-like n=1 Tax=Pimephales promelas TaxID=90988 RepID=UPI00195587F7|nr:cadherin-23-like [Pimephales promelas]